MVIHLRKRQLGRDAIYNLTANYQCCDIQHTYEQEYVEYTLNLNSTISTHKRLLQLTSWKYTFKNSGSESNKKIMKLDIQPTIWNITRHKAVDTRLSTI